MKNKFLYSLLFYILSCLSWGKYMWDKSQNNEGLFFKIIAIIFLIIGFYFLIVAILNMINQKKLE